MEVANRTLTVDVIAALTYWPGIIRGGQENPPDPVDPTVLPPFFNEVLQDLPWWNRDWKVSHVEPGLPLEIGSQHGTGTVLRAYPSPAASRPLDSRRSHR
ncbi:hypothetical protein [Streptomyces sp. NPDC018352]|uniref:hypothetical protein n=1 Tax=Streptomyces sp. NPDC018352 TaxID=3157194 RepID=UPI00340BB04C